MSRKSRIRKSPKQPEDSLAVFLEDWQRWLAGALIGGLLAWLVYQLASPPFRAAATVVVDHNLEEAWVYFPDRQLFQFLQRETGRLEELAWSDAVLQEVARSSGVEVVGLRNGALQLSHPSDGGWHFQGIAQDQAVAAKLAGSWATAFVGAAKAAVSASPELERARMELIQALKDQSVDEARVAEILEEISYLGEHRKGISPYLELAVSQSADLPTERSVSMGTYLLVGSIIGALALPAYRVFRNGP